MANKREKQRTIIEAAKKADEMHAPYIRDILLAQVGVRITGQKFRCPVKIVEGEFNGIYAKDAIDVEGHVVEEPKGLLTDGVD